MGRGRAGITFEPADITFTHDGKPYTAKADNSGRLTLVGRYRGEQVGYCSTIAEIVRGMQRLDDDAEAKKERSKRLAQAAKEPEPALYLSDGALGAPKPVGVRGIDQRSGHALITHADGSKTSVRRADVFRVLNEGELADLSAAQRRVRRTREALEAIPEFDQYDAVSDDEVPTLHARFDRARDGWVAEFEGQELFTQGRPFYDLPDMVKWILIRRKFAIVARREREGDRRIFAMADATEEDIKWGSFFHTKEDAEAYFAAKDEVAAATSALAELRADFVFDFSPFLAES